MAGVLAKTEAPPFDIMGLLLGGRGYASGWFQNRDRMRIADIVAQKELADRQQHVQGLLASPELENQIANPYDRKANWGLWGKQVSGPESFVQFGNQMLTQSTGAIYDQEQSILSNRLAAQNIKLSADEQLRVDLETRNRETTQKQELLKTLLTPGPDGMTVAQRQQRRDMAADMLGIKSQEGYSLSEGMDGYEPTIGGTVFTKMMNEGQSVSNMINSAEYLQKMLAGQGDKDKWGAVRADMLMNMKKAEELGTFDNGVSDFFATVVPSYYDAWGPDVSNKIADQLSTNIKLWKNKQAQIGDKYRVPIETFNSRGAFDIKRLSPEEEAERFGNPTAAPPELPRPEIPGEPKSTQKRFGKGGGNF